jgi:hypothetical protein
MTCWGVLQQASSFHQIHSSLVLPGLPFLPAFLGLQFLPSNTGAPCWHSNLIVNFFSQNVIFRLTSILLLIFSPILLFTFSLMKDYTMRHLVTTVLYCVGAPTVAALCECDCDCAFVVLSDRKKKRVGACLDKRKVKGKNYGLDRQPLLPIQEIHGLPMIPN